MSARSKGLLLGAVQIALVLSLGGRLLYERVTRPRVWVLSTVYDPELPIRGRYLSERLQFRAEDLEYHAPEEHNPSEWKLNRRWARLEVRNNELVASPRGSASGEWVHLHKLPDGSVVALSEEPVMFFIPEQAKVPSLKGAQQMWVEVTLPAEGPPRPLQIGIKQDGVLTPLKLN